MHPFTKRIAVCFLAICMMFASMTLYTVLKVEALIESSQQIQYQLEPAIEANLRLGTALNATAISISDWVLQADEKYLRQRQARWSIVDKKLRQLSILSEHWHEETKTSFEEVSSKLQTLKRIQDQIETRAHTNDRSLALAQLKVEHGALLQQINSSLRQILDPQAWAMQRAFEQEEGYENHLQFASLLFLFVSVVFGAALTGLLRRAVITPMNQAIRLAKSISDGDYSVAPNDLTTNDPLDISLRKMATDLKAKAAENKQQQSELEQINRRLARTNEELSQFSYRTSHDLKAPLVTVSRLAKAMEEDLEDGELEEVRQNLTRVGQHVSRLEHLVEDILDLTKAEMQESEFVEICMKDLLTDITQQTKVHYPDVKFKVEQTGSEQRLFACRTRTQAIMQNLISNSVKYRDQSRELVEIQVALKKRQKCYSLAVTDNGLGIPEHFRERVFGMFQRFHPDVTSGSGLGLYIIKKHVERMHGEICFKSSDQGTRFDITIPIEGTNCE